MPIEPFDFTYSLTSQSAQNESLNALGKNRVIPVEPKSYFFTESTVAEQPNNSGAYGPENGNSTTRFNITTVFPLTDKKAYAVTSGQVLIVPQSSDKVNVFIKPLKHVDIGVPIKYFVYRGLKKSLFIKPDDTILDYNNTSLTPFMTKVWADLIHFNEWTTPPANGTQVPASLFGFNPTEPLTSRIDSKFFNVYADNETEATKVYNLPIVEAGQHFGEFADDNGGFEIVLNDGFYYQEKSDTGLEFDMNYGRASKFVLDVSTIAGNPDISEKIYRENVQNFLDPAAFYGAHITEQQKGEVKIVDTNSKYSSRVDIFINIVNKFFNKHKLYLYIQCNRGRSFNFDGAYGTEPLKIGVSGIVSLGNYQTIGWPIIIQELEQTHSNDETDAKKSVNTLSFQLKFKTANKNSSLFNSCGNCASDAIEENFLGSKALVDESNINTQEYTKSIDYNIINTYNIASTSLTAMGISTFVFVNHEEKDSDFFNNFFGPILLTPIAKPVITSPENLLQKTTFHKKKIKKKIDNQFAFESNTFFLGNIQLPILPATTPPVDNRTRLYVLNETDASNKPKLSSYLSSTTDYFIADTADKYFKKVFGDKDNRVWKGSFIDSTTSESITSLQLINLLDESISKKYFQLGLTEVEFNKLIYNSTEVNPLSNNIPADAKNIFFHLDGVGYNNVGNSQGRIYKKYSLGVKYDTAGLLFGINTEITYPSSSNLVFVYTIDDHFYFTNDYANKCVYFEEFADSMINFRTNSATYNGEFGFDWLRIGDCGEPTYKSGVTSGYEDKEDYLFSESETHFDTHDEAYTALKKEYINIVTSPTNDDIYYVPYLNIYPQTAIGSPSPPSTVTLVAKVKNYFPVSQYIVDYNHDLFTLTGIFPLGVGGVVTNNDPDFNIDFSITCHKEFARDQIIKIIALTTGVDGIAIQKVAGIIKVRKNSIESRNTLKLVIVKVKTDTNDDGIIDLDSTPAHNLPMIFQNELDFTYKLLYQFFVYPEFEHEEIDLSPSGQFLEFKSGGKYVINDNFFSLNMYSTNNEVSPPLISLQDVLNPLVNMMHNNKYKKYIKIFVFSTKANGGGVVGFSNSFGSLDSVALFDGRSLNTLGHELLHNLGLYHVKDTETIKHPDQKFVFNASHNPDRTDNIMSYNPNRKTSWKWQWDIISKILKNRL